MCYNSDQVVVLLSRLSHSGMQMAWRLGWFQVIPMLRRLLISLVDLLPFSYCRNRSVCGQKCLQYSPTCPRMCVACVVLAHGGSYSHCLSGVEVLVAPFKVCYLSSSVPLCQELHRQYKIASLKRSSKTSYSGDVKRRPTSLATRKTPPSNGYHQRVRTAIDVSKEYGSV